METMAPLYWALFTCVLLSVRGSETGENLVFSDTLATLDDANGAILRNAGYRASNGTCMSADSLVELSRCLVGGGHYEAHIEPPSVVAGFPDVVVSFIPWTLLDVDERAEVVLLKVLLRAVWIDPRLNFAASPLAREDRRNVTWLAVESGLDSDEEAIVDIGARLHVGVEQVWTPRWSVKERTFKVPGQQLLLVFS